MKAIKFSVAAAAALAVSAFAAEGDVLKPYGVISGEVGLYQTARVSSLYNPVTGANENYTIGTGRVVDVRSYASRFGLKGAHALDGGLTAVYQVEVGFNPTNGTVALNSRTGADGILGNSTGTNDGSIANRNSFVGLAGGFGTFLIGNHDTPYKLAARGSGAVSSADTVADLHLQTDRRLKGAIAYVAPADAVGGSTIAVAIVPAHSTNNNGAQKNNFSYSLGVVVPVDPVTIGAGLEIANVSSDNVKKEVTETSAFLAVSAKIDAFKFGVAYENVSDSGKASDAPGADSLKGKYNTLLVPVSVDLGDGLYTNFGVRYTTVDKKGEPAAAGFNVLTIPDENQIDVSLTFDKKWGKDFEAYAGLKYVTVSEKNSAFATKDNGWDTSLKDSGFDLGVGLRVSFN